MPAAFFSLFAERQRACHYYKIFLRRQLDAPQYVSLRLLRSAA